MAEPKKSDQRKEIEGTFDELKQVSESFNDVDMRYLRDVLTETTELNEDGDVVVKEASDPAAIAKGLADYGLDKTAKYHGLDERHDSEMFAKPWDKYGMKWGDAFADHHGLPATADLEQMIELGKKLGPRGIVDKIRPELAKMKAEFVKAQSGLASRQLNRNIQSDTRYLDEAKEMIAEKMEGKLPDELKYAGPAEVLQTLQMLYSQG